MFRAPNPPELPGPHAVGTVVFEIAGTDDGERLVAQAWYPAAGTDSGHATPWFADPGLAPAFPYQRMVSAAARARTDATPAPPPAGGHPVVLYEHSWTGHRGENIAQVEALASEGFVVIAVDHPGQAARVRYRDGSVRTSDLPPVLKLATDDEIASFERLANDCLRHRASNIGRVLRVLRDDDGPLAAESLALDRLGVFGYSIGGTSALRLCSADTAFVAGANEDGMYLGDYEPAGPFLFFDSEPPGWLRDPAGDGETPEQKMIRRAESRVRRAMKAPRRERIVLAGTTHESFHDRIFYCRIPRIAGAGTRSAADVHRTVTGALRRFFIRELKTGTGG
ncbi:MAG: hypothetical protein H7A50_15285 [Akkermansiaceae bacterium]|nr:hypothetical protein [Akkermansiaceae bacterium]